MILTFTDLFYMENSDRFDVSISLTDDEQIVSAHLSLLKQNETAFFEKSSPRMLPVEHLFYKVRSRIDPSPLFAVMKQLPKGGNLHLHASAFGMFM
jgi:hypothetical protein